MSSDSVLPHMLGLHSDCSVCGRTKSGRGPRIFKILNFSYRYIMSIRDIYNTIKNQNTTLNNSILNMTEMYSTDSSRILYKTANFTNIHYIAGFMFYLYYSIVVIFTLILYFSKNIQWWIKVGLISAFLIYPFGIYFVENLLYQGFLYIYGSKV